MRTLIAWLFLSVSCLGADFLPETYGAIVNDGLDDTTNIQAALTAAAAAGGGRVLLTNGTYTVKRQGAETPILKMGSNTTVEGVGTNSILQFHSSILTNNWWRMLGADISAPVSNLTVLNLKMDGGVTEPVYAGATYEQNHGLFFYANTTPQAIVGVLVSNVVMVGFTGDCLLVSYGCNDVEIYDSVVGDFGRQGFSIGGGNGAGGHIIRNCSSWDNYGSWGPGGHSIHIEDGRGLTNVLAEHNYCPQGMAIGTVTGVTVRSNIIAREIVGHYSTNILAEGNTLNVATAYAVSHGYGTNITYLGNTINNSAGYGIYLWGNTAYNTNETRDITITSNLFTTTSQAVYLNGVNTGTMSGNRFNADTPDIKNSRSTNVLIQPPNPSGLLLSAVALAGPSAVEFSVTWTNVTTNLTYRLQHRELPSGAWSSTNLPTDTFAHAVEFAIGTTNEVAVTAIAGSGLESYTQTEQRLAWLARTLRATTATVGTISPP